MIEMARQLQDHSFSINTEKASKFPHWQQSDAVYFPIMISGQYGLVFVSYEPFDIGSVILGDGILVL